MASLDKRQQAYDYKMLGYSYKRIAYTMQISVAEAWELINVVPDDEKGNRITSSDMEKLIQVGQLDAITEKLFDVINNADDSFCPVSGKLIKARETIIVTAAATLLKAIDSRTKLLGLDKVDLAATKTNKKESLVGLSNDELKERFAEIFRNND